MKINETSLPGIGEKFQLTTDGDEKVVVIIHDDGRRDVYHYDERDPDESISCVSFSDQEARQLAAILGGMTYKPKAMENIEIAFDDLTIDWYRLKAGAAIIGKTIGEVGIRNNYDINVIGILRKDRSQEINPGVDTIFRAEDTVVVSGERKALTRAASELFSKTGKS